MDQIRIGSFLKELRKEKGLTQEQMAEKLNVSGRTISRWETGKNMPDISLLTEIAELYEVSIPEIINGERKSENMNEEVRETAEVMATYANSEKENMIKSIRNESIIGTIAIVILAVLELADIKSSELVEHISLYCETLISVTVLMFFFHSTGLFFKFKYRDSLGNLPLPLKCVVAAVAAFAGAFILKMVFKLLFG
ncbi:MAG: helix-turn-helix domain-containing protein [Lachnospiraceae bacterium]